jgi:hypothetical protein
MFSHDEIDRAVDLQRRSYNLLRWLSTAISKGIIQFDRAHDYLDAAAAAQEWIESHLLNLPPNCRPASDQLEPFARFFATYLTTSFELVEKPGERVTTYCSCYCPMCTYLVAAPHLRARKVLRRDKERAQRLKVATLQQVAREHNVSLDQDQAMKLIDSPESALEVSLVAYGQQLVARTYGRSEGPAVLALWREIAWHKSGSPKKDFQLEAQSILSAEESIGRKILAL